MDEIWYRNPSKSEVIGRCDGDEKTDWPRRTDKSRTLKTKQNYKHNSTITATQTQILHYACYYFTPIFCIFNTRHIIPICTHSLLSQYVHINYSPNMYTSIVFNHCFTKTNRLVRRDRRPVRCASLLNLNTRHFLMESTICLKCDISLVTRSWIQSKFVSIRVLLMYNKRCMWYNHCIRFKKVCYITNWYTPRHQYTVVAINISLQDCWSTTRPLTS